MNKFFRFQLLLILIWMNTSNSDAIINLYQQFCNNSTLGSLNLTDAQRITLRVKGQSYFINITAIANVYKNPSSYNQILDGGIILIFSIILIIITLITLLILFCFCCCCDKVEFSSERTSKICLGISLAFLLITSAMFITSTLYLGQTNNSFQDATCIISKIPYDFVYGYTSTTLQFIGLKALGNILTTLSSDLSNLQSFTSNFNQIINLKLPVGTSQALTSLTSFYNKYTDKTTTDGQGINAVPLSVSSLTNQVNSAIGTELNLYDAAAQILNGAAQAGLDFTQGDSTAQTQSTLQSVSVLISNTSVQFVNLSSSLSPVFNGTNKYMPVALYLTASLGGVLITLMIIGLLIMCFTLKKRRNLCRCGVKFCLTLVSLSVFVLAILSLLMFLFSFAVGTVCSTLPVLLNQTNLTTWINSFNVSRISLDGSMGDIVNNCLAYNGTGDLTAMFLNSGSVFSQAQGFLTNISQYTNLKNNFTSSGINSLSINATSNFWGLLRDCFVYDQNNVASSLSALNSQVSCNGVNLVLNSINCTAGASCQQIMNNNNYAPPPCATSASTVINSFNNLRNYCSSESVLLIQMIADLNGTATTTPQAQVTKYKKDFSIAFPLFDQVVTAIGSTMASLQSISNSFSASLNCTILRQELLNIEASLCFSTSQYIYGFTNFLAWFVLFTVITLYSFCCTLRHTHVPGNKNIEYEVVQHTQNENIQYEVDHYPQNEAALFLEKKGNS